MRVQTIADWIGHVYPYQVENTVDRFFFYFIIRNRKLPKSQPDCLYL